MTCGVCLFRLFTFLPIRKFGMPLQIGVPQLYAYHEADVVHRDGVVTLLPVDLDGPGRRVVNPTLQTVERLGVKALQKNLVCIVLHVKRCLRLLVIDERDEAVYIP